MPPTYSLLNVPPTVKDGTTFTTFLVLDLDGSPSPGHEVSVRFTPGVLTVVAAVERGAPPFEMNLSPGVRDVDNSNGVVDQFEGASLGEAVDGNEPIVVGEITFHARSMGKATIEPFFGPGAGVLDDAGYPMKDVRFTSSDVKVMKGIGKPRRGRR